MHDTTEVHALLKHEFISRPHAGRSAQMIQVAHVVGGSQAGIIWYTVPPLNELCVVGTILSNVNSSAFSCRRGCLISAKPCRFNDS